MDFPSASTAAPARRLRVLMLHNFYQAAGGEDQVFRAESKLLMDRGHEVIDYTAHNDAIPAMGKATLLGKTFWNREGYRALRALIRKRRPDVLHAHNTFPLISPSAYDAARAEGVPVVQTLHNYRLICANGMLLRDGAVCQRCVGRAVPWPAVTGHCYRGSALQSAVTAGMVLHHRIRGTWAERVDVYVALTSFARDRFVAGGLPAGRIVIKPNFVEDWWEERPPAEPFGRHALFVGRLAPEKGLETLLAAWRGSADLPPLRIIGDGPMRDVVAAAAATDPRITWLGARTSLEVRDAMGGAGVLLVPSLAFEGAPVVIVEAFAAGLPIIGSAHGAIAAQVRPGLTGRLHRPGDPRDLARQVIAHFADPAAATVMRAAARAEFLASYTADANYRMLLAIYARARRAPSVLESVRSPLPEAQLA